MNTGGMNSEKIYRIFQILEHVYRRRTEDAILEFGVWEGYSLSVMTYFLRSHGMVNPLYGFDGFCGLPRAESIYADGVPNNVMWEKGNWASTYDNTVQQMKNVLGHVNDVNFVCGIYENTLTEGLKHSLKLTKADIVHIDCDLVSSCNTVLNFCKSLIKVGTFFIFDEWNYGEDACWTQFAKQNGIMADHKLVQNVHHENYILEVTQCPI